MILDVRKAGFTFYGVNESDAELIDILPEYNREKQKCLENEALKKRQHDYVTESDSLFMEWKYDNTAEKEKAWRDKVAEIKARHPLPTIENEDV